MPLVEHPAAAAQDVATLLRTAVQLHQRGRIAEAEPMYAAVLQHQPDHPDALHLSGVLAHQRGRHYEALEQIDRAIAAMPTFADAHNNRGNVLRALGRPAEAMASYRQAIALAPQGPLAWSNLGNALRDLERSEEALLAYREAITRRPDFAEAHLNLGIVLQQLGRSEEALGSLEQAARARPDFAPAHDSYGNALRDAGRLEEAIESYRRAVALDPNFAAAYCNLGAALWQVGRFHEATDALQAALSISPHRPDAHNHMGNVCKSLGYLDQALSAYRQALAFQPDYPEALYNLGVLLSELNQPEEALASFRQALGFAPDFADAHSNQGAMLMRLDRPQEAITSYRRALELKPSFAGAWYNLGNALAEVGRPREALAAYDRALEIDPEYPEAHWNKGLALLTAGDYLPGWDEYEWRWKVADLKLAERQFPVPEWKGEPLRGKTILIHAEQGLGDTLQFARFLPLVAQMGGRIVLECQPSLTRLLEALPSVVQVVARGETLPVVDCQIALLALPRLFKTRLGTIPTEMPYLPTTTWSNRVPVLPAAKGLKVGIVWGGNAKPSPKRSVPLQSLAPLFTIPGISWYSLQVGEHQAQIAQVPEASVLHDLSPQIRDFADSAAFVGQLDLVISIDTSVAHLAGGLGVNLWVMSVAVPDWRWASEEVDSPWYPSAQLFRQPRPGDWSPVVEQIRQALINVTTSGEGE